MALVRLPRFKRASQIAPMQLTHRDRTIIRLVHRHRFLRSNHITALIGESRQQILRRLQLLYHHRFLERPRAQINYYQKGGSRQIVYGIGSKGTELLEPKFGAGLPALDWGQKNRAIKSMFLEHALLISDVMVALELACRKCGRVRFVSREQLSLPLELRGHREPFRWRVTLSNRSRLGLIPDQAFALESTNKPAGRDQHFFFLEADRSTMPVMRHNLSQTSFYRKLLAYEATWRQELHRSRFGFHRFQVLVVTSTPRRVESLVRACQGMESGRGLFLFADWHSLAQTSPLTHSWRAAGRDAVRRLLGNEPF